MKKAFILLCVVWAIMGNGVLACAEEAYYVNPDGGRYYHAIANCPAIHPKYWDGMVEITEEERNSEKYKSLFRCETCFASPKPQNMPAQDGDQTVYFNIKEGLYYHSRKDCSAISEKEYSLIFSATLETLRTSPYYYKIPCDVCFLAKDRELAINQMSDSAYFFMLLQDRHQDVSFTEAGTYIAGVHLPTGLFTFDAAQGQTAELSIIRATGESQFFVIEGPGQYSFALFEGDRLTMDGHGKLHDFTKEWLIWDETFNDSEEFNVEELSDDVLWVKNGRYLFQGQLFPFTYSFSCHDAAGAKIILTQEKRDGSIQNEAVFLQPGESITIDVNEDDYRFVEIINCDIRVLS